ncbi:MAG: ATP-binding cassette domain-containing protein [Verrucomicrobiales bacterium]
MIEFRDVTLTLGRFVLGEVSFTIPSGAYGVLMGTSGSGKTTLLEILCGLRKPDAGAVVLMGEDRTLAPPGQRNIGYVPQDGALFTHFNVFDNLVFALRIRRERGAGTREKVEAMAESLGVAHLLKRQVHFLSGGEKQRVALGRALLSDPDILCLDEPLAALDEETHERMIQLLRRIHRGSGKTFLHVTHRVVEAEALGDTVIRLRHGKLAGEGERGE